MITFLSLLLFSEYVHEFGIPTWVLVASIIVDLLLLIKSSKDSNLTVKEIDACISALNHVEGKEALTKKLESMKEEREKWNINKS